MLAEFDLAIPTDLGQALHTLAEDWRSGAEENGHETAPLAGGTNLLVDIRARRATPARLVALGQLDELRGIAVDNGRVTLGGRTTLSDILRDPRMAEHAPSLVQSARVFGGQMVRNAATLAGNVCYGSPAADVVPPLLSLDAELTLTSQAGSRVVPLNEFFLGYKQNIRRHDELLTEIAWPLPSPNSANLFYKLARRKGDAITVVGLAVTLVVEAGKCSRARIALGAVAPVVKRAVVAEDMLVGQTLTPALIDAATGQAVEACEPIDDVRASAEYRRHGVHVLTRRLLMQAWDRLS
jgi:CO/xanthine dehydrogenase FAD-binding subunit